MAFQSIDHCACCEVSRGHRFEDTLWCDCGVHYFQHQENPSPCSKKMAWIPSNLPPEVVNDVVRMRGEGQQSMAYISKKLAISTRQVRRIMLENGLV